MPRTDQWTRVHIGNLYDDINYEVEVECCGETKTMFIDENDAMGRDHYREERPQVLAALRRKAGERQGQEPRQDFGDVRHAVKLRN